jgi:hypothetical protein
VVTAKRNFHAKYVVQLSEYERERLTTMIQVGQRRGTEVAESTRSFEGR